MAVTPVAVVTFINPRLDVGSMPSVRISEEHNQMLEEYLDQMEEEIGVRGTKKDVVEKQIEKLNIHD